MKKINVNGVAINVASGFSVSISADGTVNIDKDFEDVIELAPVQQSIEQFHSEYRSNILPNLKYGDVAKQCREYMADPTLSNKIIAHSESSITSAFSRLTNKQIIITPTENNMEWVITLADRKANFNIAEQVNAFKNLGETLPIKAHTSDAIRSILNQKGIGCSIKKTSSPDWFMVTTKEVAKYNRLKTPTQLMV